MNKNNILLLLLCLIAIPMHIQTGPAFSKPEEKPEEEEEEPQEYLLFMPLPSMRTRQQYRIEAEDKARSLIQEEENALFTTLSLIYALGRKKLPGEIQGQIFQFLPPTFQQSLKRLQENTRKRQLQ